MNTIIQERLEQFDTAMNEIKGCSDGFCYLKGKAQGMHTNGGCRCVYHNCKDGGWWEIQKILRLFWELRYDIERINVSTWNK